MRSLAISDYCTPDKYEIATVPTPTITNASDVLIKVHAASINPVDVKLASGIMRVFASDTSGRLPSFL
jgi:NADPH:quinone reductase-like Zn-dependent oxidoreductase